MTYYFSKTIHTTFDIAIASVTKELEKEGFGIITEINVTETFKEKLNAEFRPYKILGACNPEFAYNALSHEDNIGVMLPCNIVIQEKVEKEIMISVINPILAVGGTGNKNLESFAVDVSESLLRVLTNLE
jgi:uncharacterized protein (DUF302 family)